MATLRDDLIPVVDELRRDVVDLAMGLRIHEVVVRTRTWDGGAPGRGTPTDVDLVLDPVPRIRQPRKVRTAEAGKFEDADLRVDRVSADYFQDDLDGGSLDANQEFFWLVDGSPYRVVEVEERYLEWRVGLKRMRNRP